MYYLERTFKHTCLNVLSKYTYNIDVTIVGQLLVNNLSIIINMTYYLPYIYKLIFLVINTNFYL